jgi:hypothetical protein
MSDFAGIENAKTSEKNAHLAPGCSFVLEVMANKKFKSRKGETWFAAEFSILEASGPDANPVGSVASYLVKMTGNDSALGNIKGYVAALINEPPTKVDAKMCEELVGVENPGQGTKVRVTTVATKTGKGGDFTLHKFSPYIESASSTVIPAADAPTATTSPAKGKTSRASA